MALNNISGDPRFPAGEIWRIERRASNKRLFFGMKYRRLKNNVNLLEIVW